MMTNIPYITDLLGVKYVLHGRNKKGFDCYGLAIEVSKRFGHTLHDFWYDYIKSTTDTFIKNANYGLELNDRLKKTNIFEAGNIIIFFENKKMVHIGVLLKKDDFIHCDNLGVRISKVSDYFRKDYIIYSWKKDSSVSEK